MASLMKACVNMQNITVLERKCNFTGTRKARITADATEAEGAGTTTYHALVPPGSLPTRKWLHEVADHAESHTHHAQLQTALVEHMYTRAGQL